MSDTPGFLNTTLKKFTFDTNITIFTSIIGIFILILPIPSGSIYGYGLIFFALSGMMILNLALQTKTNMESGFLKILKKLFFTSESLPIICVMLILAWLFSLNLKYYDKFIEPNMLPNEFIRFKNLATGLLFVAIILIKSVTKNDEKKTLGSNNNFNKIYNTVSESSMSILYLVILLLAIITGLMQVILKYYLTDG